MPEYEVPSGSKRKRHVATLAIAVVLAGACWSLADGVAAVGVAPAVAPRSPLSASAPQIVAGRDLIAASQTADPDEAAVPEADEVRCMHDWRSQLQKRRAQMGAADDPDAAFEPVLLTFRLSLIDPANDQTQRELTAARRRWPASVELAWLGAQRCSTPGTCASAWRHLAALEPDNAAVWLMAMGDALRKHDQSEYEQALERAAAARVFEPHHGLVFLHARAAISALPVPDSCRTPGQLAAMGRDLGRPPTAEDWEDMDAVTMEGAFGGGPAYGALNPCRASQHPSGTVRQDCIALLTLIGTGSTLLDQKLALHMLMELNPDGIGSAQLRERYRGVSWLVEQTLFRQTIAEGELARQWTQGEVATVLARAIAEGRWPPPANWLPDSDESRALVRTGHPPGR